MENPKSFNMTLKRLERNMKVLKAKKKKGSSTEKILEILKRNLQEDLNIKETQKLTTYIVSNKKQK